MRVSLLPDARPDMMHAFWWYESQRPGLGFEFLRAADASIEWIVRMPEARQLVGQKTRKLLLRRFPYVVLFSFEGGTGALNPRPIH